MEPFHDERLAMETGSNHFPLPEQNSRQSIGVSTLDGKLIVLFADLWIST